MVGIKLRPTDASIGIAVDSLEGHMGLLAMVLTMLPLVLTFATHLMLVFVVGHGKFIRADPTVCIAVHITERRRGCHAFHLSTFLRHVRVPVGPAGFELGLAEEAIAIGIEFCERRWPATAPMTVFCHGGSRR